jgi:oligopeptide/dipeptide ABC transporter ATP-binding protein
LFKQLQAELGTSVLFITHNLAVVAQIADEVAVMYLGRIVEQGPVRDVLKHPRHPYTQCLLDSLPDLSGPRRRLRPIRGAVPGLREIPPGCPFHPRCPHFVAGRCDLAVPDLRELAARHHVACVRAEELP